MTTAESDSGGVFDEEALEVARVAFARPVAFLMGAAKIDGLPPADLPEVAFAGRSNVGKSSLINALVGQKHLARASNEPGRTREVNFFVLEERLRLVDLPGYGFARASKTATSQFQNLGRAYLRGRPNLKRVYLLIDARHGLKAVDAEARRDRAAGGEDPESHLQTPRRVSARAGHVLREGYGHARAAGGDPGGDPRLNLATAAKDEDDG